jgi:hypothetical protein
MTERPSGYAWVGRRVRVHLYNRHGILLGTLTGRVSDFAAAVEVAPGQKKDLLYVVDLPEEYANSSGGKGEAWFAVQDCEPEEAPPGLSWN